MMLLFETMPVLSRKSCSKALLAVGMDADMLLQSIPKLLRYFLGSDVKAPLCCCFSVVAWSLYS